MAGELWRGQFQIGREITPGTPVAATRVLYVDTAGVLTRARTPNPHMFMTGTRDNTRALTVGPVQAAGTLKIPLSADEIIEPMLLGVKGGVTPTTPSGTVAGRQWVFVPSTTTPDSATIEWFDGAQAWQGQGMQVNTWDITGSVGGTNDLNLGLFGRNLVQLSAMTGSLTQRTPTFYEGWESLLYIDPFGATPGTTAVPGQMLNWSVKFSNQMARKYLASNTLAAAGTPLGTLTCTADITFEAAAGTALSEYNFWENGTAAPTKRMVRLAFGNNAIIDTPSTAIGTTTSITQSGTLATYTVANSLIAGQSAVNVTGATPAGYNGTNLPVVSATGTNFTVNLPVTGLANATVQGTVTGGIPMRTKVYVDLPGSWTTVDLSKNDSQTRVYTFGYQYVYDPTNAFGIQITAINARTTAY